MSAVPKSAGAAPFARYDSSAMALHEIPELRDRTAVFRDRDHAGEVLAEMLQSLRGSDARVLAIPAGGVPVAAALCRALALPLGVAVVSKITLPWNTEVGYGAVAFDGTVLLNDELVDQIGLDRAAIDRGVEETLGKVRRRLRELPGAVAPDELAGHPVVLVDDGLASGFTMRVAIEALRGTGPGRLLVAVPTGSPRTLRRLEPLVEELHCANVRGGLRFAVAEAYAHWSDVEESEAARILGDFRDEKRRLRRAK